MTLRLRCGGAVRRQIKEGKAPAPFTGYRIRQGQFIYSRIDARNGAFALVPEELDGAVVSKDFPVFDVSKDLEPAYLLHFLKSGRLQQAIRIKSLGATNRQRISEESLLGFRIPLPCDIGEQRRIAAILDKVDALQSTRSAVLDNWASLRESEFDHQFNDSGRYGQIALGEVATLASGKSLAADHAVADSPYRVIKISAVTTGVFKPDESKPLPPDYVPPASHLIKDGDLLMSRANTASLVGASALVSKPPANLALPDKVWRFVWRSPDSVPVFYHALLGSAPVRRALTRMAGGTGGSMKNISQENLLGLMIPDVPYSEQREFAAKAEAIDRQRETAELNARALADLTGSLRARAFSDGLRS
ncbi:hypothetical protein GCM10027418_30470 [Mariniluteicoccus endophyticus]